MSVMINVSTLSMIELFPKYQVRNKMENNLWLASMGVNGTIAHIVPCACAAQVKVEAYSVKLIVA